MTESSLDRAVHAGASSLRIESTPQRRFRMVVDGVDGPAWVADFGPDARLEWVGGGDDEVEFIFAPRPDVAVGSHGVLTLRVRARFDRDGGGERQSVVRFAVTAPEDYPLADVAFATITPSGSSARDEWRFLIPDGEGLWLDADGQGLGWRPRVAFNNHRITLPMTALVHASGSGLMVSEVEGHDHAVDLVASASPREVPGMRLVNLPSLGTWRYEREWTVATVPAGGAVALADELSRQLRRGGYPLETQSAKLAARGIPESLRRSVGGTILWCHFDLLAAPLVRNLSDAGLTSIMLMGRPADAESTSTLTERGFATGPYFQTYDIYPTDSVQELGWRNVYPPEGATDGWTDDLIHDMGGWLDDAWPYIPNVEGDVFWRAEQYLTSSGTVAERSRAVHHYTPVKSYRRCPSRHRRIVEKHGIPMLDRIHANAVFYDIATAMHGLECYHPEHVVDRRDDVRHRRDVIDLIGSTGRIVHSETGKWWAIDQLNAFEGMFSYDADPNIATIQVSDYPYDPNRAPGEFNLEHRVPFFGMVARHAISRTMWWGTGQDRHAETWAAKDAITALYGANPIYIIDPLHPLEPGAERWDRFVTTTAAFDVLREVALDSRVVSYETDGPSVGRTVFENGTSVEANIGQSAAGGLRPGQFIIRTDGGTTVSDVSPSAGRA